MFNAKNSATELYHECGKIWTALGYEDGKDNFSKVGKGIFGDFFEDCVINFIKEHINNSNYEVIKGLIKKDKEVSPQIDIIVCDRDKSTKTPSGYFGAVDSKYVKLAIEVKSYLDKPTYEKVQKQINDIKPFAAKTCLFSHHISWNYKKQCKTDKISEALNFTDYFVVLAGWEKGVQGTIYDYGNGMSQLIEYLRSL